MVKISEKYPKNNNTNYNTKKEDTIKKTQKKTKKKKVLRKCISGKEFDFLVNKINDTETNEIMKFNLLLLNSLLFFTGLRISEVLLLDKLNIAELLHNGSFRAYCKKTQSYRWIYLIQSQKEEFLNIFKCDIDTLLKKINTIGIVNQQNNKMSILTASRRMDKYFDMLNDTFGGNVQGVDGRAWGFHSYRVNFINKIIRKCDIDQSMKLIGHKNVSTTLIYFRQKELSHTEAENLLKGLEL